MLVVILVPHDVTRYIFVLINHIFSQVRLLKDVLEAWRREVEKKPPSMTAAEAYAALGLDQSQRDEAAVRKAYYRLAQQYHPDKNPEGRVSYKSSKGLHR